VTITVILLIIYTFLFRQEVVTSEGGALVRNMKFNSRTSTNVKFYDWEENFVFAIDAY